MMGTGLRSRLLGVAPARRVPVRVDGYQGRPRPLSPPCGGEGFGPRAVHEGAARASPVERARVRNSAWLTDIGFHRLLPRVRCVAGYEIDAGVERGFVDRRLFRYGWNLAELR